MAGIYTILTGYLLMTVAVAWSAIDENEHDPFESWGTEMLALFFITSLFLGYRAQLTGRIALALYYAVIFSVLITQIDK